MMIIGIDPGVTGAIAFFEPSGVLIDVEDMPTEPKLTGKGERVSPAVLKIIFGELSIQGAIIEMVHGMPGQGGAAMFNFGHGLGVIESACLYNGIKVHWVTPQEWKRHHRLTGKDKDAARGVAIREFPHFADMLRRKKDCDRADAILIGAYGIKKILD